MDQSTTPKPVMDVTPPKSADAVAPASHQSETIAASQSGSDRNDATPSSATVREPGSLTVHTAPPLSDDDKASAPEGPQAAVPAEQPRASAHTGAPTSHGPAAAITFVVLAMLVLSALAVLVYRNS